MGAVTVKVVCQVELEGNGQVVRIGTDYVPTELTAAGGEIYDQSLQVSAAGAEIAILYLPASGVGPANFDFLAILSDTDDVVLELTTDRDAGVGKELYTVELRANIPFLLGSDDSYANYTENFAGGTLDVIDRILAKNLHATQVATVRIVAAT